MSRPAGTLISTFPRRRVLYGLSLLVVLFLEGCLPPKQPVGWSPRESVILVSLDGFRFDYLNGVWAPNLVEMASTGVRSEALVPVFPSKTFPAHYSLATGLYPGHHGIFSNKMYDPQMDATFELSNRRAVEDPRWWLGEPIWVSAEKQGLVTAALYWPGSEAEIAGVRPSYWGRFEQAGSFEERVSQILTWLDLPALKRPRLIVAYFEEPNETSHRYGPQAGQTRNAVQLVDGVLGALLKGLQERLLLGKINVVVVSDHGMAAVRPERVIVLDDYVQIEDSEILEEGALVQIFPKLGREQLLLAALRGVHPRLAVYGRAEIPQRFHLEDNPRLPPILAVPDVGWSAMRRDSLATWKLKGDHGQDPRSSELHGIFVASGPAFANGLTVPAINSVQVYGLVAAAMGIEPAPTDAEPELPAGVLVATPRPYN